MGTDEVDDNTLTGFDVNEASLDETLLGAIVGSGRRVSTATISGPNADFVGFLGSSAVGTLAKQCVDGGSGSMASRSATRTTAEATNPSSA